MFYSVEHNKILITWQTALSSFPNTATVPVSRRGCTNARH